MGHVADVFSREVIEELKGPIAIGHVLAVAAAHDRAISRYPHDVAVRSQYPMLGVMVISGV